MPVHPLIAARFDLLRDVQPGSSPETPEVAQAFAAWSAPYAAYTLPDVAIEDRRLDGPHGPVPVRLYRPPHERADRPAVLWMHGGGFVGGDLDMPEAHVVAAELAARVDAVVVSVDYRLASETVHYPVPLDDVSAAWGWVVGSAEELGIDPARIAIGGASAGANLAVAAALRIRDAGGPQPSAMLLAYPALHFPVPALDDDLAAEMRRLPATLRFFPATITNLTRAYLGRITDIPSHLMPGLAALAGLPPAAVVLSEYDDLRSSGELFVQQLGEVGVPASVLLAIGMLHGHLNQPPVEALGEIGRSIDHLAAAVTPAQGLPEHGHRD